MNERKCVDFQSKTWNGDKKQQLRKSEEKKPSFISLLQH